MNNNLKSVFIVCCCLAFFSFTIPLPGNAEGITEEQANAILNELKEIRELLKDNLQNGALQANRPSRPKVDLENLRVSVKGEPYKGDQNAKVTIIEFSDYQCPYCARHFRQTFHQLNEDYIMTGKIKYVFRDFPLQGIHPLAVKAAEAANCSAEQGKYWELHDLIFTNQKGMEEKDLDKYAEGVGLQLEEFKKCLDNEEQKLEIQQDIIDGRRAGIRGTPTFFIGNTQKNKSEIRPIQVLRGAQSYFRFKKIIDELLEEK